MTLNWLLVVKTITEEQALFLHTLPNETSENLFLPLNKGVFSLSSYHTLWLSDTDIFFLTVLRAEQLSGVKACTTL